jgi:hypothetical protein
LTLVYCNPLHHDTIMKSRLFSQVSEFDARDRYRYVVYTHQPAR